MAAELDITNQRFNHFVALRKGPAKSGKWWFRCDCGTEGLRCKSSVVKGNARSCGCQRARQITKKTKQEICSLYSKGELSFAQIEKTYGINHRRIPEILEAGGVQRLDREDAMRRAFKTIQIGDKFGNLTVVTDLGYKKGSNWWKCECVCGKTVDLDTKTLNYRKETNLSCGCQRAEGIRHKLEGQVFGLLTLTEYQGKGKWKAICECGNTVVSSTRDIKNGHTQSCGCIGIGEDSISGWLNETFRFPERDGFFYVF